MANPLVPEQPHQYRFNEQIERAKAGDKEAISHLIEQFRPLVTSEISKIANRLGSNGLDAHLSERDIAQETWTRIWSRLPSFEGSEKEQICKAKFITWLRTVTRRIANAEIDKMLAIKRGGGKTKQDFDDNLAETEAHTPSSLIGRKESAEKLVRLIEKLKDEQAIEILRLRFYEAKTLEQVSEEVGISIDQVRYKLSRTLSKFKSDLL